MSSTRSRSELRTEVVALYGAGHKLTDMAASLGISVTLIHRLLRDARRDGLVGRRSRNSSPETRQRAIELHESGKSIEAIANEVGFSSTAVSTWLEDAGALPPDRPGCRPVDERTRQTIIDQYNDGVLVSHIATSVGRGEGFVLHALRQARVDGLVGRRLQLPADEETRSRAVELYQDHTIAQISELLGYSEGAVQLWLVAAMPDGLRDRSEPYEPSPRSPAELGETVTRLAAHGQVAPSTKYHYGLAYRRLATWCEDVGLEALPATPETVSLYLTFRLELGRGSGTLYADARAIGWTHRQHGLPDPAAAREVRDFLKGAAGRTPRPRPRAEFTSLDAVRAVVRADPVPEPLVLEARLYLLGRAQQADLDLGQLLRADRGKVNVDSASASLVLPATRAHRSTPALPERTLMLSRRDDDLLCPVHALEQLLNVTGGDGPLFAWRWVEPEPAPSAADASITPPPANHDPARIMTMLVKAGSRCGVAISGSLAGEWLPEDESVLRRLSVSLDEGILAWWELVACLLTTLDTGLRIGDALQLHDRTEEAFRWVAGKGLQLVVPFRKNDRFGDGKPLGIKERNSELSATRALRRWLDVRPTGAGELFIAASYTLYERLQVACDRAGVPRFSWHSLRYLYIAEARRQGASRLQIALRLGVTEKTIDRYCARLGCAYPSPAMTL